MYCSSCGTQVREGSVFCSKCGMRLSGEPARPAPPPFPSDMRFGSMPAGQDLFRRPVIVTILAILNFLAAAGCLIAAIAALFGASRIPVHADPSDSLILYSLAGGSFLFLLVYTICAIGLWSLRPYGRMIQIILAAIWLLPGFPVGTVISILILVYLMKPEVKLLFSGKSPHQLQPQEAALLSRMQTQSGGAGIAVAIVAIALFGVMMLGIISAIAIPNFLNALQRGKQKRTMADMRAIGTACEAYAVDNNFYPEARTIDELASLLQPKYIRKLPTLDAWEHAFVYEAWSDDTTDSLLHYRIISFGKDSQSDGDEYFEGTTTTSFNNDIIFSEGTFVVYPEGTQH